ncbi:MAG: hypothetical protein LBD18_05700, partial [Treponema sp.]|nr:hypothetical protein [Treponema sp.]
IAWGAWRLLARQVTQRATTMPVPMSIIYMVMPVSAVLSFVFILCKLAMMWSSGTDFEKDEKC